MKGTIMAMNNILNSLAKVHNGVLTFQTLIDAGISKRKIKDLLANEILIKVAHGVYYHKDYFVDDMYIFQIVNSNVIYSHETAAYLQELTDRYPRRLTITTHQNKHLNNTQDIKTFYVKRNLLNLGKMQINDNAGNIVLTYDKERTVCDIIKSKDRIELQIYTEVIQEYFKNKPNIKRLYNYATSLGIDDKVKDIIYLMMKQ